MTSRNDRMTKRIVAGVTVIGLGAGADSYVHIYGLARDWHQNIASAALAPLTADGLVFASSAVMFAATRQGKPVPFRARFWFWAGTTFTVAGNGASGWTHGLGTALLAVVPVIAYIGCMESLTWMLQHLGVQPEVQLRPQPAASRITDPDALEVQEPDAPDELRMRRQRKTSQPLGALLAIASERFPDAAAGGSVPALRRIQKTMGIGQPKAQEIQRHFRTLQASAQLLAVA